MEFKQLRTFRTAARTLNFSEAAQQLGYVQSAVTSQIRGLESHLATRLFIRNGRGVQLTDAGEKLLDYADRLCSLRDEAEQVLQPGEQIRGELTIAGYETIITYRLPRLLSHFIRQYPEIRLNMVPLPVKQLKSQVLNGQLDIAFSLEESAQGNELTQRCLRREPVVIIAPPTHPLAGKAAITAGDLRGEALLLTEKGCNYRNRFERALIRAGAYDGPRQEFISIEAIKACVKLGTGIAAISEVSVEQELANGELVALDWQGEDLSVGLYVMWNPHRWLSPAVEAFLAIAERQEF